MLGRAATRLLLRATFCRFNRLSYSGGEDDDDTDPLAIRTAQIALNMVDVARNLQKPQRAGEPVLGIVAGLALCKPGWHPTERLQHLRNASLDPVARSRVGSRQVPQKLERRNELVDADALPAAACDVAVAQFAAEARVAPGAGPYGAVTYVR